jgi:HSP20 family protein
MTLVRYEPWGLSRDFVNEFSRLFDRVANNDESTSATADWVPPVDIEEHTDKYVLNADVPGVDPGAIEITLENGVLTLSGSREKTVQQNGAASQRIERISGRFLRRFTLPESVDADAVTANGKNGVLEVVIPKRATAQPRRIAVKG